MKRRQRVTQARGIRVEPENCFERRQRHLVDAERAFHWIAAHALDQIPATDDETCLGTTQQLVSAERNDVGAGAERVARRRLVRKAVLLEINEHSASQVHEKRQAMLARERGEISLRDRRGEALYRVIAGVHLHERSGAGRDCAGVVLQVRAVGGSNFPQLASGARHDVGNAKSAADLDQLAAGDGDFLSGRQRVERKVHGGGIVVHDERGFRPGQLRQPALDVVIALSALSTVKVELEVDGACHGAHDRFGGRLRHHGAPEIGVEHRPGQVEHRLQRWSGFAGQPCRAGLRERLLVEGAVFR